MLQFEVLSKIVIILYKHRTNESVLAETKKQLLPLAGLSPFAILVHELK